MVHYFKKELVTMPFHVNGSPVKFENVGGNRGLIGLDDANPATASIISALNEASAAHRGGIVKISEADYNDLKKNRVFLQPLRDLKRKLPFGEQLRIHRQQADPFAKKASAVPAVIKGSVPAPKPAAPPPNPKMQHILEKGRQKTNVFKPATGRASKAVAPPPPSS